SLLGVLALPVASASGQVSRPSPPTPTPSGCVSSAGIDRLLQSARAAQVQLQQHRTSADSLICLRLSLASSGARARPGFQMPPGDSWLKGASRLFVDLATPSPQLVEAMAVVGSNLSTPISTVLRTAEVLGKSEDAAFLLRPSYTVLAGGGGTPALARACVSLAFDAGRSVLAHACARGGRARGEDSTWFASRLAHLAASRRRTVAVWRWFALAAKVAATDRAATPLLWHLEPHRRGERLADNAPGRLPSTWAEAFALMSPRARVDWLRQRAVEL